MTAEIPELDALQSYDRPRLVERWKHIFRHPPPKHASKDLMQRAIAWELQASAYGGLKPATVRKLEAIALAIEQGRTHPLLDPPPRYKPGTTIIREWYGRKHVVMVVEDGFAWDGRTWANLSQIAREITGTRWNGPAFFGLRKDGRRAS